jgi:hypothetical protein
MSSTKEGLQTPNLLVPIIHMSALRMVCIHAKLFDCTEIEDFFTLSFYSVLSLCDVCIFIL